MSQPCAAAGSPGLVARSTVCRCAPQEAACTQRNSLRWQGSRAPSVAERAILESSPALGQQRAVTASCWSCTGGPASAAGWRQLPSAAADPALHLAMSLVVLDLRLSLLLDLRLSLRPTLPLPKPRPQPRFDVAVAHRSYSSGHGASTARRVGRRSQLVALLVDRA